MKSNFRTSITVPEKCWTRFRDILSDYCAKMKKSSNEISNEPSLSYANTLENSMIQTVVMPANHTASHLPCNANKL